jgi:hypothetical protein
MGRTPLAAGLAVAIIICKVLGGPEFADAGPARPNWGTERSEYTSGAEYDKSKGICRALGAPVAPPGDMPTPAQRTALSDCRSEPLYYGEGGAGLGGIRRAALAASAFSCRRLPGIAVLFPKAALAGVGWCGSVFHTKIARSAHPCLQPHDWKGLAASWRYIRFPSPAPFSGNARPRRTTRFGSRL